MRAAAVATLAALWALATAAAPAPATAPGPHLEVAVTPRKLTVGDRVTATLTVTVPAGRLSSPPRFPEWREAWGDAEILSAGEPQRVGERAGEITWRQRVVLAAFKPGDVPLPPVRVAVPLEEKTTELTTPDDLALHVESVLPAGEKSPKPRPPADPRPLPLGAAFWWTAATLATFSALLAALLWRRRRASGTAPTKRPRLAPLAELEAELARLPDEASLALAHVRLSLALRRYLGRCLGFPAPESTTGEIRRQLLGRRLPGGLAQQAVAVLYDCDLVKFARHEADRPTLESRVTAVRQLARRLDRHLAPPPVAVPPGDGPADHRLETAS